MRTLYEVLFYVLTLGPVIALIAGIVWAMRGKNYHG